MRWRCRRSERIKRRPEREQVAGNGKPLGEAGEKAQKEALEPLHQQSVHDLDVARSLVAALAVSQVGAGLFRLLSGDPFRLLQGLLEGVSVVGIARERLRPEDPVGPRARHQARFPPELVALVGLSLGDAFGLRLVHRIVATSTGAFLPNKTCFDDADEIDEADDIG